MQGLLPFLTAGLFFSVFSLLYIFTFPAQSGGLLGKVFSRPEINSYELAEHVKYLASDGLGGRLAGTPGAALAEDYVASAFAREGLKFMPGENSYFLEFDLYRTGFDSRLTSLGIFIAGRTLPLKVNGNTAPLPLSGEGPRKESEMVFAGYGITAPEAGWDDYRGTDMGGKTVILLRGEPDLPGTVFEEAGYTKHAQFGAKIENAKNHGATAVIVILYDAPGFPNPDELLASFAGYSISPFGESGEENPGLKYSLPCFVVSEQIGNMYFENIGENIDLVRKGLDAGRQAGSFDVPGAIASLGVGRAREPERIACRNVVGFLPGTDPESANEWILVTAHHDHIGTKPSPWSNEVFRGRSAGGAEYSGETADIIYNGADDNASGVAGVLELAGAFAEDPSRRKRSMLFVTFSAEEEGLLGSEAFVRSRLARIPAIKLVCNLDMIGRNPDRGLSALARDVTATRTELLRRTGIENNIQVLQETAGKDYYSDDFNFSRNNIPTIFFFSGLHADYHGLDDEWDRIDYGVMEKRVRFVQALLLEILQEP